MFYRTRPFFFLALHSPSPAPAHANKRVMLERWSPKSLAASAAVLEPSRTVRMISCCWCGLNLAGRPTLTRDLGPSPFTDHRPLEFSKTSQHLHHHAARRGCRIHRLSEAPKASACLAVRYVLVRMIVGSPIVHGRYNGSAQETESIPLTEYFPIFRVPEYSELPICVGIGSYEFRSVGCAARNIPVYQFDPGGRRVG